LRWLSKHAVVTRDAGVKAKTGEGERFYLPEGDSRTEHSFDEIVGNSPAFLGVLRKVRQFCPTGPLPRTPSTEIREPERNSSHGRFNESQRPARTILVRLTCSAISAGLVAERTLLVTSKALSTVALEAEDWSLF